MYPWFSYGSLGYIYIYTHIYWIWSNSMNKHNYFVKWKLIKIGLQWFKRHTNSIWTKKLQMIKLNCTKLFFNISSDSGYPCAFLVLQKYLYIVVLGKTIHFRKLIDGSLILLTCLVCVCLVLGLYLLLFMTENQRIPSFRICHLQIKKVEILAETYIIVTWDICASGGM